MKKIHMKQYIRTLMLAVALAPVFSSCDYLDKEPDDMLTLDAVFDNADYTKQWLAGVYNLVPDPLWEYMTYEGYGYYMMSDETQMASSLSQFGWSNLMNVQKGNWTPTTIVPGKNLWLETYRKVRAGLIFMENVKEIPNQRQTAELVERYKNEVRFLMAYYYSRMLEVYGPFPLVTSLVDVTESGDVLQKARTPYDEIVDYLDNEFMELSKVLPSSYDDVNVGRPTSGACLALRARMLMFAASPLFNGNEDFRDVVNKDGTPLFSQSKDNSKWERAAKAAKLVIDMPEYDLYKEYLDDGSIDALMSCINLFLTTPTNNKEIILAYPGKTNGLYEYHLLPRGSGWAGCISATQNVVDAFFMKNGLPKDDDNSEYVEEGFSTKVEARSTNWTGGTGQKGEITAEGTYNMYCNREPRFYTAVSYNGSWYALAGRKFEFFKNQRDNDYTHDAPQNGYLVRKKVYPQDSPKNGSYKWRQMFLYRLAASYLDYAEAVNEAYDNRASREDALKYVNKVRERAGVRQYTLNTVALDDPKYIHVDDNQLAVRAIVRMERRVELCCEGSRWSDIRRWKIVEQLPEMCGDDYGMNFAGINSQEFYKRTVFQTRVWKKAMYWLPVYIDEMNKNTNLVQAPFWN